MNTFLNGIRILFSPRGGWQQVADDDAGLAKLLALHTVPFALMPALCWYYGMTTQGWEVAGEVMKLTPASAAPLCTLFFLAMVFGVIFLGYMVCWMSVSYGEKVPLRSGIALISYTATPFFVAGLLGLYPILWLDIVLGTAVACYCIALLYIGVSYVLPVGRDRGFLYASAVFAVALVSFVGLLTATVILWDFGVAPEYTY